MLAISQGISKKCPCGLIYNVMYLNPVYLTGLAQ